MNESKAPRIIEFGPVRVIGLAGPAKGPQECKALWDGHNGFPARSQEIDKPITPSFYVGICRCIPGVTDGTFEYIAAMSAEVDAIVPAGMVAVTLAAGTYAVFSTNLATVSQDWDKAMAWLQVHPEWKAYCDGQECDCATHPAFELYPANFTPESEMFIYMPVHPAE
jgi:predicted transcriptional regulator YdeE